MMKASFPEGCLLPLVRKCLLVREHALCRQVCTTWKIPLRLRKLVLNIKLVPFEMIQKLYVTEAVESLRIVGLTHRRRIHETLALFPNIRVLFIPWYSYVDFSNLKHLRCLGSCEPTPGRPLALPANLEILRMGENFLRDPAKFAYSLLAKVPNLKQLLGSYNVPDTIFDTLPVSNDVKQSLKCAVGTKRAGIPDNNLFCVWLTEYCDDFKRLCLSPHLEILDICSLPRDLTRPQGVCWPALKKAEIDMLATPEVMSMLTKASHLDTLGFHEGATGVENFPSFPSVHTITYERRKHDSVRWLFDRDLFPQLRWVLLDFLRISFCAWDPPCGFAKIEGLFIYIEDNDVNVARLQPLALWAQRVYVNASGSKRGKQCDFSGETIWYFPKEFKDSVSSESCNLLFLDDVEIEMEFERFKKVNPAHVFNAMSEKYMLNSPYNIIQTITSWFIR